jgi:multidrug efflux pump subunit AcrA (membrane-fusion protein)
MALVRAEASVDQAAALVNAAEKTAEAGRARARIAAADVLVAAAQRDAAKASRDQAAATLKKTEVRAPFAGIVVLKDAEVGEVVSPNVQGGSNARGSVATMVDFASLEVQCDVPETSLAAVDPTGRATIFLDAWPQSPYPGQVSRIWPTANRTKATIEVRVRFDRPDERLRPEMGVRVVFAPPGELSGPKHGDAAGPAGPAAEPEGPPPIPPIIVPIEARVRVDGKLGVFVVERDAARFVAARFGDAKSGQVAVEEGLEGGEQVIVDAPSPLDDGDRVQVTR